MKSTTIIISISEQDSFKSCLEKIKSLKEDGYQVVVIDVAEKSDQNFAKNIDISYFHCVNEHDKIITYNAILKNNATIENDVLFIDESILPTLSAESSQFQEMYEILHYTEKHGFVSPRIDTVEDPDYYFEKLKLLPRFSISIEPDIRLVYIKKNVLNLLDYFDSSYDNFHFAFLDFVQRANSLGLSSVISNHIFIPGVKSVITKYGGNVCDETLFTEKFPYYAHVKKQHTICNEHSIDIFLANFKKPKRKKRILFNCHILAGYDGTAEYQLAVLNSFYNLFQGKYDIFIHVTRAADDFHQLSKKYLNVLYPDTISGVFDLGFSGNQFYHQTDQILMNQYCIKTIYTVFDIITLRCYYINSAYHNIDNYVKLGIQMCDGIITISDFSNKDFRSFFAFDEVIKNKPIKRVYCASNFEIDKEKKFPLPFGEYFLIVGNSYKHKVLSETIETVRNASNKFVVLGHGDNEYIYDNVYGYASGQLENDFVNYLYANCKALIFPSVYEGFGIPIAVALNNNKRVILHNNSLNNELLQHFKDHKSFLHFFDNFSQINDILETIDFPINLEPIMNKYTWDDAAREIETFFDEILRIDVSIEKLRERNFLIGFLRERERLLNTINEITNSSAKSQTSSTLLSANSNRTSGCMYRIFKRLIPKRIKELIKHLLLKQ